jgi:hypothetical protein
MKYVVITAAVLALSGCGWFERKVVANLTGYSKICIDGVQYLQFPSGVTPQYTQENRIVTCK